MFLIFLMSLFNSFASTKEVINKLRFTLSGDIYIGMPEFFMGTLFIGALLFAGAANRRYPNLQTNRAFVVMLILLVLGGVCGTVGAVLNGVGIGAILRSGREYISWPIFIFIGYRLLPDPRKLSQFLYVLIVCGIITATMLLLNFGKNAEVAGIRGSYGTVRTVSYLNAYSGMAAMTLAYAIFAGVKVLPHFLALGIAVYTLAGQCAPLHRGEWVAMAFCGMVLLCLVPSQKRVLSFVKGVGVGVLLVFGLLAAVAVASSLTGRDFMNEVVMKRIYSLLPTERQGTESKAWDTRTGSIKQELAIWLDNPVTGAGFAAADWAAQGGEIMNTGAYNHNGWASVLAKTGLFGFAGSMMIIGSLFVLGYKLAKEQVNKPFTLFGVLAVMSACYMFIGVLAGIVWTTRYAMLFGVICGMAYRCRDMIAALRAEEQEHLALSYEQGSLLPEEYESSLGLEGHLR